jgi:hypothetical protein
MLDEAGVEEVSSSERLLEGMSPMTHQHELKRSNASP